MRDRHAGDFAKACQALFWKPLSPCIAAYDKCILRSGILVQGFSVVQEASLMVQSFPHAPDVFALLKELAVLTGQYNVTLSQEESASQDRDDLRLSATGPSQVHHMCLLRYELTCSGGTPVFHEVF